MKQARWQWCLLVFLVSLTGCSNRLAGLSDRHTPKRSDRPALAVKFNSQNTGNIKGTIKWSGEIPLIPKFHVRGNLLFQPPWGPSNRERTFANPNRPKINPTSRGVSGAVVFLLDVDRQKSRLWNHQPVTVVIHDYKMQIYQGKKKVPVGFVRLDDPIQITTNIARFHLVRANGAAFFSLTLPKPNTIRERSAQKRGVIELSSGAAYFWMRKYLFVDDHPYYACTNEDGEYQLDDVPAGTYELIAWLPNWQEKDYDYDPEQGSILRLHYAAPVKLRQTVEVHRNQPTIADFTFRKEMFRKY